MRFQCPNCPEGVIGLRGGVCPHCGYTLTVGNLFGFAWARICEFLSEPPMLRCPACGRALPSNATRCLDPTCGAAVTSAAEVVRPKPLPRDFMDSVTPGLKVGIQWGYFVAMVAVLIVLLTYADGQKTERWPSLVMLAMIYLAVLTLVAKMVVPIEVIQSVVQRATVPVKLGLICTYFCLLLLMMIILNTWWSRAIILAVLFGVSWMGLWVFRIMLAPWLGKNILPRPYNPAAPQGRRGRYD